MLTLGIDDANIMVTVFHPNPERLVKLGLGRWKNAPVLFDHRRQYMREASRYLRDRATRNYSPMGDFGDIPRPETLRTIAYRLAHFFKWTLANEIDWATAPYDAVLDYQNSQLKKLSTSGKFVRAKTANRRADETTHFLHWAALNGLREPFPYGTKFVQRFTAGRLRTITVRLGRAAEASDSDEMMLFPTADEVKAWLLSVRKRRGEAKWLACRFVLETGARRSEVAQLTIADWPDRSRILKAIAANRAFVGMTLRHGTKGGKQRNIRVPVAYAMEVCDWCKRRDTYAYRFYKRTGKRTDRMFLSDSGEHAGTPLSGMTIWRCFHEVTPRPDGWTTHSGRHAYAVFMILYALEREAQASQSTPQQKGVDWIYDRGRHWLLLLRKQFGHVSEETTQIYLKWLATTVGISDYASGWHHFLNAEDVS